MMNWILFGPSRLMEIWPSAGVVIGSALCIIQLGLTISRKQPINLNILRQAAVAAGLLWLLYGFYELQVTALQKQNNNVGLMFRLDLLVWVPVIYLLTAAAIQSIIQQLKNK